MNTAPRKRVPCATSSPSLLPQQASKAPSVLPRWCPQWSTRALRLLLTPAAFASLLLALACTAWLYSQSCGGPLQGGSQAFALGPFPAYTRPQQPQPPLAGSAAPLVDIVYVSAFPQHLRSSLRSLCHFLAPEGVGSVHLVVPDRMVAFFQESLPGLQCPPAPGSARRLGFRVWGESTLVPEFTQAARHTGTVRQMALKLAAATIVSAPFYLVMDSDVYARQPFGVADLLLPSSNGRLRARTGLDQLDYAQPDSWFRSSAHLLQTPLVADTDAFCAAQGSATAQWFAATGNATVPPDAPFALQPGLQPGARVYGACRSGRGHATHVTPMLLSRELVADVLLPRLARAAAASAGHGSWVTALLDYQALREAQCWHALTSLFSGARFYTWTEYSLYFVAGVASGALDQFHAFPPQGGITSYRHSIMMPDAYEAADWDAIFTDASDPAPFFIVHSWFNKPLAVTNARLSRHIPGLAEAEAAVAVPQPSALPLYA